MTAVVFFWCGLGIALCCLFLSSSVFTDLYLNNLFLYLNSTILCLVLCERIWDKYFVDLLGIVTSKAAGAMI